MLDLIIALVILGLLFPVSKALRQMDIDQRRRRAKEEYKRTRMREIDRARWRDYPP